MTLLAGLAGPFALALDVAGGKMYWSLASNPGTGRIERANLDGSSVQDVVTGLVSPDGIALDLAVGGLAHGFQPTKIVGKNVTTGKRVKITLTPSVLFWDCAAAGLVVRPGDSLKMTLTGSE